MDGFLTIAEAGRQIAAGTVSPVELVDHLLARIAAIDPQLDSFVTVIADQARTAAREAETAIRRDGPRSAMHGIPYALKDVIETGGIRSTGQSRLLADHIPKQDATVARKLRDAGGILLGKNATWEFAHGGPSWDVLFPPAHNPWNTDNHPAGSSSGSGAAIAAGLTLGALGTDTGGSIRGPAAACGIAGLKPTYGLLSRRGVMPNCFSHDHVGPMAWTVEDTAILLAATAGHDPLDPASADKPLVDYPAALTGSVAGKKIGVPWTWLEQEVPLSPETRRGFDAALDVFKSLGATLVPVELPKLQAYDDAKKVIAMVELFTIHGEALRTRPDIFGASLRYRIICGGLIRGEDYVHAMRCRSDLARAMQAVFKTVDLMMLPTGEPAGKLQPTPHAWLFTHPSFTTPFNVGGNPALALCSGFAGNGMPQSLQIVGRLFDDAAVLNAGDAYERATTWRARRPVLEAA